MHKASRELICDLKDEQIITHHFSQNNVHVLQKGSLGNEHVVCCCVCVCMCSDIASRDRYWMHLSGLLDYDVISLIMMLNANGQFHNDTALHNYLFVLPQHF